MNRRYPRYPDDADYQTNASSYYEDLARKNKLIKKLAKRIWEYDKILADSLEEIEEVLRQVIDKIGEGFNEEIYQLLVKWVEDGTLDHIINETIFNWKADKEFVDILGVTVEEFGAAGDGITDDTIAFERAIEKGCNIHLKPNTTYLINHIELSTEGITLFGNHSTLLQKENESNKPLINIISDSISIQDLTIVGFEETLLNKETISNGISSNGNHVKLNNIITKRFFYGINVLGDYNKLSNIQSFDSYYGGIRLMSSYKKMNIFTLTDYYAKNNRYKSFVYNGTKGVKQIFLKNIISYSPVIEEVEDAFNDILIDGGHDNTDLIDYLFIDNFFSSSGGSGCFKNYSAKNTHITNSELYYTLTYDSGYSIRNKGNLKIDTMKSSGRFILSDGNVEINNVSFKNLSIGPYMDIKETIYSMFLNDIRILDDYINESLNYLIRLEVSNSQESLVFSNIYGNKDKYLLGVINTIPNTTLIKLSNIKNKKGISSNNGKNLSIPTIINNKYHYNGYILSIDSLDKEKYSIGSIFESTNVDSTNDYRWLRIKDDPGWRAIN